MEKNVTEKKKFWIDFQAAKTQQTRKKEIIITKCHNYLLNAYEEHDSNEFIDSHEDDDVDDVRDSKSEISTSSSLYFDSFVSIIGERRRHLNGLNERRINDEPGNVINE